MKKTDIRDLSSIKVLRPLMIIGFSVLLLMQVSAQSYNVNFSGNWVLNKSKSKFGDGPFRMPSNTLVVIQEGISLTVERTMQGTDGEMKMTNKYTLDGKVSENIGMMNIKSKSTVTWSQDKSSVTIATTMNFDINGKSREMKSTEVWKLEDAGKSLIIEATNPTPDGDMKSTAIYDKK